MAGEAAETVPVFSFRKKPPLPSQIRTSKKRSSSPEPDTASKRRKGNDAKGCHQHKHRSRREEVSARSFSNDDRRHHRHQSKRKDRNVGTVATTSAGDQLVRSRLRHGYEDKDFKVDLRGDPEHLTMRMIAGRIPAHYRLGMGHVLGLPGHKVDRYLSDGKVTVLYEYQDSDLRNGSPLEARHTTLLKKPYKLARAAISKEPLRGDYISLKRTRAQERNIAAHPRQDNADGPCSSTDSTESDDYDVSDHVSEEEHDGHKAIRLRNAELERQTKNEPQNVQAWLDLIEHQHEMMRMASIEAGTRVTLFDQRALSEIRLKIYDEALMVLGDNSNGIDRIILGRLEEGSKIWSPHKLSQQWHTVLQHRQHRPQIWIRYLDYLQSNAKFEFNTCLGEFKKCLAKLASENANLQPYKSSSTELLITQLRVFLRLTKLMAGAGYHEQAEALWQALLEMQFFKPAGTVEDPKIAITSFEEFWSSEAPRVGETGAKGWCNSIDDTEEPPSAPKISFGVVKRGEQVYESFAVTETDAATKTQRPGKVIDEMDADDPFHTILFSDLIEFVGPMCHDQMPKEYLVQALVCFYGLPPIATDNVHDLTPFFLDPYLRGCRAQPGVDKAMSNIAGEPTIVDVLDIADLRHCCLTTDLLFSNPFPDLHQERAAWILRAFTQILQVYTHNDTISEYVLALCYQYDRQNFRQYAKEVLGRRRNSIVLANAYVVGAGLTARSVGDIIRARFKSDKDINDLLPLWRTLVYTALNSGNLANAIHHILSIGEMPTSDEIRTKSSIQYIKVQQLLKAQESLSLDTPRKAVTCVELEALLVYLCSKPEPELSGALEVFNVALKDFENRSLSGSVAHEELHQARTKLVLHHIKATRVYQAAALSAVFEDSLAAYPNNTFFMSACSSIRSAAALTLAPPLLSRLVSNPQTSSVVNALFRVRTALLPPPGVSPDTIIDTTPRARRAFEQAAESSPARHAPAFWTAFFLSEIARTGKEKSEKRAREVFFRGLAHLPWSKWYVMLAFKHASVFKRDELKSLWASMGDRGFRLHIDISEFV